MILAVPVSINPLSPSSKKKSRKAKKKEP